MNTYEHDSNLRQEAKAMQEFTYHNIPQHTTTYHNIPQHTTTYHNIPQHTTTYHNSSSNDENGQHTCCTYCERILCRHDDNSVQMIDPISLLITVDFSIPHSLCLAGSHVCCVSPWFSWVNHLRSRFQRVKSLFSVASRFLKTWHGLRRTTEEMCNVTSVGRHAKEAYAATIEAYPSLKDPGLKRMWEQNVKQTRHSYWDASFSVAFHLRDAKAMAGVFELIHFQQFLSIKQGFSLFQAGRTWLCIMFFRVLWLILSLETNGPLNEQVQH